MELRERLKKNNPVILKTEEHYGRDGSVIRKRKKAKVFYSVGYSRISDPENYYRELIMLYMPWRNDNALLGGYLSFKDKYNDFKHKIDTKYNEYRCALSKDIVLIEQEFQNNEVIAAENMTNNIDHEECIDQEEGARNSKYNGCFNPGNDTMNTDYDLASDIGVAGHASYDFDIINKELDDQ